VQYSVTMSCPGTAATPMGPVTLAKTLEEAGPAACEDERCADFKVDAIKIAEPSIRVIVSVIWSAKARAELIFFGFIFRICLFCSIRFYFGNCGEEFPEKFGK